MYTVVHKKVAVNSVNNFGSKKPILITFSLPQAEMITYYFYNVLSTSSKRHCLLMRFANQKKIEKLFAPMGSIMTPPWGLYIVFGFVWPWPLTSWPQKLNISCPCS